MSSKAEIRRTLESKYCSIPDAAWKLIDEEVGDSYDYDEDDYANTLETRFQLIAMCNNAKVKTKRRATVDRKKRIQYSKPLAEALALRSYIDTRREMGNAEVALGIRSKQYTWDELAQITNRHINGIRTSRFSCWPRLDSQKKNYTGVTLKRAYYRAKKNIPEPMAMRWLLFEYASALRNGETTLRARQWVHQRAKSKGLSFHSGKSILFANIPGRGVVMHEIK